MLNTARVKQGLAACGYAGFAVIIVLSLVPGTLRPHTGAGGGYEHWLAYMADGLAFGLGYARLRPVLLCGTGLALGAGLLELAQLLVPGRNSEIAGFLASTSGAWAGLTLGFLITRAASPYRG
jgi:hypothetical protein